MNYEDGDAFDQLLVRKNFGIFFCRIPFIFSVSNKNFAVDPISLFATLRFNTKTNTYYG